MVLDVPSLERLKVRLDKTLRTLMELKMLKMLLLIARGVGLDDL